jgi:hypothetical protein
MRVNMAESNPYDLILDLSNHTHFACVWLIDSMVMLGPPDFR